MNTYAYKIAGLVLEILALIALLGFFIWSVTVKQPTIILRDGSRPLPLKYIRFSIVSYIV